MFIDIDSIVTLRDQVSTLRPSIPSFTFLFSSLLFRCEESPLLRIREHSSKALLALIPPEQYSTVIEERLQLFVQQSNMSLRQNTVHGRFLHVRSFVRSFLSAHIPRSLVDQRPLSFVAQGSTAVDLLLALLVGEDALRAGLVDLSVSFLPDLSP